MATFVRTGNCEYGGAPFLGCDIGNVEYNYVPYIGTTDIPVWPAGNLPFEGDEMLRVVIPRNKYWKTDYPNLEDRAEGIPIPELWGEVDNITPVCIDTTALTYKIAAREIKSIEEVRVDNELLVEGTDYTTDLPNAEFTLTGSPFLSASTLYYIVLTGTYGINGTDYCLVAVDSAASYADGQCFYIDNADVWSGQASDIYFKIYGKASLDAEEELILDFSSPWAGSVDIGLRDVVARTKLAQSFTTPAGSGFYLTRVSLFGMKTGSPSGTMTIAVHSDQIGTTVGTSSQTFSTDFLFEGTNISPFKWDCVGLPNQIQVKAQGYKNPDTTLMTNVADIIADAYINLLEGVAGDLDTTAFTALEAARTQALAIYLDTEMQFNEFIEKLEAGQLFKFIPTLDGKYTVTYYAAGEPAGTPHFYEEDMADVKMRRLWNSVFQIIKIKYQENSTSKEFMVRESSSNIAAFFYSNNETLTVETWLSADADAEALAASYVDLLEYPLRLLEFTVRSGYGFSQVPTDKVKITRTRADNVNGTVADILFRIFALRKNIGDGSTEFVTALDTMTY